MPPKEIGQILAKVLSGASLKSLCHGQRATYAMICETLKRRPLLERALVQAGLSHASPVEHAEQLLLAHEVLFGRGLRHKAIREIGSSSSATSALRDLRRWHASLLRAAKLKRAAAASQGGQAENLVARDGGAGAGDAPPLPRYARVNTLKTTVTNVCAVLELEGYTLMEAPVGTAHGAPPPGQFWVDPLIPTLLVLPAGSELHTHTLVQSSAVILQDKASCMAPVALAVRHNRIRAAQRAARRPA